MWATASTGLQGASELCACPRTALPEELSPRKRPLCWASTGLRLPSQVWLQGRGVCAKLQQHITFHSHKTCGWMCPGPAGAKQAQHESSCLWQSHVTAGASTPQIPFGIPRVPRTPLLPCPSGHTECTAAQEPMSQSTGTLLSPCPDTAASMPGKS